MKLINSQKSARRKRNTIILLTSLACLLIYLAWYQLFYAPPRVYNGVARLTRVFEHHQSDVWVVKFFPDGQEMASCSVDGTLKIFDRSTGRILKILAHPMGVTHFDISMDGRLIATTSYDGKVRIWDTKSGRLIKELSGHSLTPWAVQFSPDADKLLSSGEDSTVRIWDVASGILLRTLRGHTRTVWDARFSPDGRTIASGSFDATIRIWDAATGRLLKTLEGHSQAVAALIFSHDGKMLATASDDKTIKLWNTGDYSIIRTLEQPEHAQAVAFSPDDRRLLTGGRDKTMLGEALQNIFGDSYYNKGISARLWDVQSGAMLQTFSQHANDANDVTWSCDGKWIASGSSDKTVALWEIVQ